MTKSIFISHPIYQISSYGVGHPLAIPRVSLATDLVRALGWLDATNYIESRQATIAELTNFHDVDYVQSLISAEIPAINGAEQLVPSSPINSPFKSKLISCTVNDFIF